MEQIQGKSLWDVVIVGAGAAGLTASIYLARAGKSVLVLEKGAHPGGRAASTEIAGSRVNLGPHALFKSTLAILREVNVQPAGTAPKPPGMFVFKQPDGQVKAVPLTQLLLGSFLKWHEKMQLIRFYRRLYSTDTSALHKVSMKAYLEGQITSPRVRSIVYALVRVATYSDDVGLLSAGAAIEQLKHGQVLYVDNGWQSIIGGLAGQAQQAGVVIRTNSSVQEIAGSYPEMKVTLKDTQVTAKYVLSTAGPSKTLSLLNPSLTPAESAIYSNLIPVHAACLDLIVSGLPEPKTKFVLGADDPWYYSNHSTFASLSDHPDYSVIHVMKYLSAENGSNPKQDEEELRGFLDVIQPGWREHVVQQRFLPKMLVSHGVATAGNGGLPGRPGPAVEGRPGLYVAGDWVGSEGMLLHASLASAKEAAHSILAGKEIQKEGIQHGA